MRLFGDGRWLVVAVGDAVIEALELVFLGYGAGARRVAVGEKREVAGEGGVRVVGAAAGGVACGGGGGGGAGGGEEERADHGDALGEVEREELTLVEEFIGGAESGGGFARRD